MTLPRPNIKVRTRQIVVRELSTKPYVGFENTANIPDGWLYDIKRWSSPFDLRLPTLPRLSDPSTQGVLESEYFQSGVGSVKLGDLYVKKVKEFDSRSLRSWFPIIRPGHYFRLGTPYYYYSDDSKIQYIDSDDDRDNRNYIELDATPNFDTPILAANFFRNSFTKIVTYHTKIEQKYKFTGTYVGGEEQETVSELGKITWDNIDTTKREFIVDHNIDQTTRLFFNKDYMTTIGIIPAQFSDLGACEYLGISTGVPYQAFYLKQFPVLANNTFHIYVADSTSWEEWTQVNNWWDLITIDWTYSTRNRYFIDKDLGIIYFGSSENGGIPPSGRHVLATYKTTLRVEYEERDRPNEIVATEANTNPVTQNINQGFVCITHSEMEPAHITLSVNKSLIQGTINPKEYGPVVIGSDYAVLKATVTNPSGIPIPKIRVDFTLKPSFMGQLSSSSLAATITNSSGFAFSHYQPPVSADPLGFYSITVRDSTHLSYPGDREVIIKMTETGLENKEEDIYLYQILKDDVVFGYDSLDDYLLELYNEDTPAWVHDSDDYARWKSEMTNEYDLKDWIAPEEGKPISGRKVVTYQIGGSDNYDSGAINPITGEPGAVVPLRPYLVEKIDNSLDPYNGLWRLIYPAGSIPNIGTASVGGYWVVSSRLVTFQASCWSPYYNAEIFSNTIMARVSLPQYLLGEYLSALGEKVPFGWKLFSETDNVAAGLDGATFITINPHQGPYEVIDIVGGTGGTGVWVDGAPNTLHFQFKIV
jgi:hypothetical protein